MAFPKPCRIINLSSLGARVDLLNAAATSFSLASVVTLYIPADNHEIDCRPVWRSGAAIGLQFISLPRAATRRYPA